MPVTSSYRVLLIQIFAILLALQVSWGLRFEFAFPDFALLWSAAPLLVLLRLAALGRMRLLHGYWRYTGTHDAIALSKAILLGSAGFAFSMRYVLGLKSFPLSVYAIEAVVSAVLLGGIRVAVCTRPERPFSSISRRRNVLIIGAGFAAQMLIRELAQPESMFEVVGCVDDDSAKIGIRIHGVPVLGNVASLPKILLEHPVHELLIAIPSATRSQMRELVRVCELSGKRFRTIPGLRELVQGKASVGQFRDVNLEDLLGRDPVQLDLRPVHDVLAGQGILVTGAAGSIGSEICSQILEFRPSRLVCLDHDETALFHLQASLRKINSTVPVAYVVADFNDRFVSKVIRENAVKVVIHAAAYKHVPLMEVNVVSALRNNVFALHDFVDLAESCGCSSFLLVSSDKAVCPSSFMGATKRIGELILSSHPGRRIKVAAVRFGNVLGSQGSVVPVFQQQIATERRILLTHADTTRFFMTIPEAVSLVLQALAVARNQDILVLDMGAPVKILDLAHHLIRLTTAPEEEVRILFTGLRKGEKLHEELFYSYENPVPTSIPQVLRTRSSARDWSNLSLALLELKSLADRGSDTAIRLKVKEIVPEYSFTPEYNQPVFQMPSARDSRLALNIAD